MSLGEIVPKRTRYRGIFTDLTEPAASALEAGAWWFNSDRELLCFFDGTTTHRWGRTEGHFYTANGDFTIPIGGGCASGTITVPYVTTIMFVVSLTVINTNPSRCDVYTPQNISLSGNVIGITVGGVTGTTVTVRALVSGYPSV